MKELPPAYRTIAPGIDLLAALAAEFGERGGYVQASGWVEDVELAVPLSDTDVTRAYRGRFVLAQLLGPVGGPYGVTLARAAGEGVESIAGVLVRARSSGVSACCVGTGFVRHEAPEATLGEPTRPLVPVTSGRGAGFASRVLSAGLQSAEEEDEAEEPEPGDLVEHFAFGLCEVIRVSGDQLTLRDRKSGRIREVRHGFLKITGPIEHEGKRLFELQKG